MYLARNDNHLGSGAVLFMLTVQ